MKNPVDDGRRDARNIVRKNDLVLFGGLLLVGIVLFAAVNFAKTGGAQVDVHYDGAVVASYPLDTDREVDLTYNGHNLLKIEKGRATVIDADCPELLCTKQRAISKEGESIVCLPHKLVITVSGGKPNDVDGVLQ
ncbi:MAG: NusG domain II-containing protein [Actinomycetes bacterium]|jgi:hypothetical protein|nr:NusG domain II-containing protein [Actinomycetes bacterium]